MQRHWLTFVVYFAAAFVAYHNCFNTPFVFDDAHHIVENARIRSFWPVWPLFRESSRPLVQFSLALNFAISGLNVWSYHLLNVLVHLGAACALQGIVRRTLERSGSERLNRAAHGLAFTIALLWLLHPLQTGSVTYIIQRGESLMGLFCLLTLYCFIRSVEPNERSTRWLSAAVLCCIFGLASKPIMAIAPLLVLFYDRMLIAGSFGGALRLRVKFYAALFGSLALLPLILAGKTAEWAPTAGFGNVIMSPLDYAATQPKAVLHYLRLTFWPNALCLDYGWVPEGRAGVIAASSIVLGCLIYVALRAAKKKPALGFAVVAFLLTLAPTSSFIPIADVAFEHRMYLALAAVLSIAVSGGFVVVEKIAERSPSFARRKGLLLAGAAVVVALLLAGRTIVRNDDYASDIALWTSAIEVSPESARAHYNLGTALMERQRIAEAAAHLQKATEIRPPYSDAHYNLGNALMAQGKLADAVMSYRRALTLTPEDWQMHNNLGVAMLKTGDVAAATIEFKRTLELNPECASARANLAKLL